MAEIKDGIKTSEAQGSAVVLGLIWGVGEVVGLDFTSMLPGNPDLAAKLSLVMFFGQLLATCFICWNYLRSRTEVKRAANGGEGPDTEEVAEIVKSKLVQEYLTPKEKTA